MGLSLLLQSHNSNAVLGGIITRRPREHSGLTTIPLLSASSDGLLRRIKRWPSSSMSSLAVHHRPSLHPWLRFRLGLGPPTHDSPSRPFETFHELILIVNPPKSVHPGIGTDQAPRKETNLWPTSSRRETYALNVRFVVPRHDLHRLNHLPVSILCIPQPLLSTKS